MSVIIAFPIPNSGPIDCAAMMPAVADAAAPDLSSVPSVAGAEYAGPRLREAAKVFRDVAGDYAACLLLMELAGDIARSAGR